VPAPKGPSAEAKRLEKLREQLQESKRTLVHRTAAFEKARASLELREKELATVRTQALSDAKRLDTLEQEREDLLTRSDIAEQSYEDVALELKQLSLEAESLRKLAAVRSGRIAELEEQLAKRDKTSAGAQRLLNALREERDRAVAAQREADDKLAAADKARRQADARIAQLELDLKVERGELQEGDDLKRIRGIGPRFEKALKALGVMTFDEIAAWSPGDVEEFAGKLKVRPGRIAKDGWIESARTLAKRG
jgi:predicted flap endonuclease-1-like 5' DNA nuclease